MGASVCASLKLISFSKATMSDHKNRHAMSCSFLSPIPISAGVGGIAVNVDGTLFAFAESDAHCVYIYNAADCTVDTIVVGTACTSGSAHGFLKNPTFVCFVHRDGLDTLLICDYGNNRVVEVTSGGVFMRAIALPEFGYPWVLRSEMAPSPCHCTGITLWYCCSTRPVR